MQNYETTTQGMTRHTKLDLPGTAQFQHLSTTVWNPISHCIASSDIHPANKGHLNRTDKCQSNQVSACKSNVVAVAGRLRGEFGHPESFQLLPTRVKKQRPQCTSNSMDACCKPQPRTPYTMWTLSHEQKLFTYLWNCREISTTTIWR